MNQTYKIRHIKETQALYNKNNQNKHDFKVINIEPSTMREKSLNQSARSTRKVFPSLKKVEGKNKPEMFALASMDPRKMTKQMMMAANSKGIFNTPFG